MTKARPAAVLDVDGTLVDTNYHHALAWYRAFREQGRILPLFRIHRHIGMGGDQLVAALAGDEYEAERGDATRDREGELYEQLIGEVQPLDGARDLLLVLRERGHAIVLASSARASEVEYYLDLLDARDLADDWTTSDDVERTKPEPDLVAAAVEKAGGGSAVMLGDSTWDCEAAERAGVPTVGILTGGFSEQELRDAGAGLVVRELRQLIEDLDDTPFGAR